MPICYVVHPRGTADLAVLRRVYEVRLDGTGRETLLAVDDPVLHAHVRASVYFNVRRDVGSREHVADSGVVVADHVRRVRFREEDVR